MFTYPGTQHGFNNDTTPRYDKAAAALAWQRTMDFFKKKPTRLRGATAAEERCRRSHAGVGFLGAPFDLQTPILSRPASIGERGPPCGARRRVERVTESQCLVYCSSLGFEAPPELGFRPGASVDLHAQGQCDYGERAIAGVTRGLDLDGHRASLGRRAALRDYQ